jgi:hypothetical protein
VKSNQKTLLDNCISIADSNTCIDVSKEPYVKEHGRIEARTAKVFPAESLGEKWHHVESIIKIERERMIWYNIFLLRSQ